MVTTTNETGQLEIKNLPKAAPFQVNYEDYSTADAIQVDIQGIGVFKFFEPISDEILTEIHTNINKQLTIYGKKTGHNPANIGYFLDLKQQKKLNQSTNTLVVSCSISIFFKKPVKNATVYSLQPTITLISLIILCEIFHLTISHND
jgi:hypothetical protein